MSKVGEKTTAMPAPEIMPGGGIDPDLVKQDFPVLRQSINGHPLIYLDNAATTQKPVAVIKRLQTYYESDNANVHRGLHTLAERATDAFEATRDKIRSFINAGKREEIIYTRGATEAINLVAYTYGRQNVGPGDRIVITRMEHHANLIPWLELARQNKAELVYIPINSEGYLDLSEIDTIINNRTKIVALTHMSNVLGTINDVEEITALAHKKKAVCLIDGAQAVPHMPVDVQSLGADFYVFSAHKMLGPTGLGVLYGREELLQAMPPFNFGGEMISEVRFDKVTWNVLPWKFEAGTPAIAEAVAFAPALDYLENLGMENIRRHEIELTAYALSRLSELKHLTIYGPQNPEHRGGAIAFSDDKIHPHDMATFLDTQGIAVRAGHHCAQPLTRLLGVNSTTRASFYIYNNTNDIDTLHEALLAARRYFGHG